YVRPYQGCPARRRLCKLCGLPLCGNNSVVECDLAKVEVAGSNPVSRSIFSAAPPVGTRQQAVCHKPVAGRRRDGMMDAMSSLLRSLAACGVVLVTSGQAATSGHESISPDRGTLLVANQGSADATVIDLASGVI